MELNDAVFGVEINVHRSSWVVVRQLTNNRRGTIKAKTRSEVRGGGRKSWRQKGTESCKTGFHPCTTVDRRQCCIRSGLQRDYEVKMNKKERKSSS